MTHPGPPTALPRSRRWWVVALKGWQDRLARRLLARPVPHRRYEDLADDLDRAGRRLRRRIDRAGNVEVSARKLRHIIGIERWGQRRLRVFLGAPYEWDEHHPHQPAEGTPWPELARQFDETRATTVALARALARHPHDPEATVEHNEFGGFTARGWLRYVTMHGEVESTRLR